MSCTNHPAVVDGVQICERCSKPFCRNCLIVFQGRKLCGVCKNERIRAVQSGSAEGSLQLASIGRRWGAMTLDGFISGMGAVLIFIPLMLAVDAVGANVGILGNLVTVGVYGGMIAYDAVLVQWRGQTLGKRLLGIKVVNADGSDVSAGQAWGRAAAKVLLNLCMGIGYLLAIGDAEKRTLHDRLAKTRVVRL